MGRMCQAYSIPFDGKRCDLAVQEAKIFRDVEILEPGHLDLMEIDNMCLEERRCEQSQETSVKTDKNRYRYRGILEQEIDHVARYRDVHDDAWGGAYIQFRPEGSEYSYAVSSKSP